MKVNRFLSRSRTLCSQAGQTFIMITILIGLFLLGMLGVVTDYSQVWARRQMAQAAADASCEAGAADLFLNATDPAASGTNGLQSFSWIPASAGTGAFDCTTNTSSTPCGYASLNGYTGANVNVSFPTTLPNVAALPAGFGTVNTPYIQVTVNDTVTTAFTRIFSKTATVAIHATAGCGVVPVSLPTPLVILHQTSSSALSVSGSSVIKIFGGPQRSIEVNSNSASAVSVGTVNLSQGGPADTGSDFAVFGGPTAQPAGITLGTTGHYLSHSVPISDPFATVSPPTTPNNPGTAKAVPVAVNGCPDPAGCVEFTAGNYASCSMGTLNPGDNGCLVFPYSGGSSPKFSAVANNWQPNHAYKVGDLILPTTPTCTNASNTGKFIFQATTAGTSTAACPASWNQTYGQTTTANVVWKNVGVATTKPGTAIFDPGIYYVGANGLNLGSNSTVRMSTATGDGSLGIMFYFSTAATVAVTSNSGKASPCTSVNPAAGTGSPPTCLVSYQISGTTSSAATGSVPALALQCPAGSANPPQVPTVLDGNILLGPCTGTYKSPDGNRGFLFFQNRSTSAQPSWGGGGQFLSSGFLYFHSGSGATCGTSTTCLTLQGGSGSQSFTLGNIVVDKLSLGGNPQINMILNPAATFAILKPTLLQ